MANKGRIGAVPQGEWASGSTYKMLDWVTFPGGSWLAVTDTLAGESPTTNPEKWMQTAKDGENVVGSVVASGVTNDSGVTGTTVKDALNNLASIQANITTSVDITTSTLSDAFQKKQYGRNVRINNGSSNITLTCLAASESDFIASYTKLGTGSITVAAESGMFIIDLTSLGKVCNGATMSSFTLERFGGNFYLKMYNV